MVARSHFLTGAAALTFGLAAVAVLQTSKTGMSWRDFVLGAAVPITTLLVGRVWTLKDRGSNRNDEGERATIEAHTTRMNNLQKALENEIDRRSKEEEGLRDRLQKAEDRVAFADRRAERAESALEAIEEDIWSLREIVESTRVSQAQNADLRRLCMRVLERARRGLGYPGDGDSEGGEGSVVA